MALKALMPPIFPASAAFHAQQAAEKAMKAYLVASDTPFKQSHNLPYLRRRLYHCAPWLALQIADDVCATLSNYAVGIRYPKSVAIEPIHGKEAISEATAICRLIRQSLYALCP